MALLTPGRTGAGPAVLLALALVGSSEPAVAQEPPRVTTAVGAVVSITAGTAIGTGFVTEHGILTAAHVVTDVTDVRVWRDGQAYPGRVVRTHPSLDLALVAAELPAGTRLQLDTAPDLGEPVTVVAVDPATGTVLTRGIVSALPTQYGVNYLQTDAAVNPGTSGGPVLGDDGRVLGLVVSKDRLRDDIGLAHLSADLSTFVTAPPTASDAPTPVAAGPLLHQPSLPPAAPIGVAAAVVTLGVLGWFRGRITRPSNDIRIELGPVRTVHDDERNPT